MSNWKQVEAQWHVLAAQVKAKWAKLTDDDLKMIAGKREVLVARLQERYGDLRADAEKRADAWAEKLNVNEVAVAPPGADKSHPERPEAVPADGKRRPTDAKATDGKHQPADGKHQPAAPAGAAASKHQAKPPATPRTPAS